MESALENGCLSSPLRRTPQSKGEEEEKSATSTESAQTSWQCMISINDPATQVVRDKIPKNNLIAAIHQRGSTGPEASLCGGSRGAEGWGASDIMSDPLLKSWRSWPGFLLVACQGLSRRYREIINDFFNISLVPKRDGCWNPMGEKTLSGPQSHTKGPAKSQVHETTTAPRALINNIAPRRNFHTWKTQFQITARLNPHTQIITRDIWSGETKRSRSSGRIFYFLAGDVCGRRNRFDPSAKANGVKPRLEK